jgi:SOS-response transcriptional repressor LexA
MKSSDLIRQGRVRLGLSEQAFATAVGVTRAAVQQWERADGTAPKRATQLRVAELLGVSVSALMAGAAVGPRTESVDMRSEVPVVSEIEAGGYTAVDNFKLHKGVKMVPINVDVRRHTFAVRVHGDSMVSESHDSFPEGSVLIVEPDMEALPGDYVIARNSDGGATFKQLVKDGGEYFLKPLNARYPIRPLGTSEIIGVVREFSKTFR